MDFVMAARYCTAKQNLDNLQYYNAPIMNIKLHRDDLPHFPFE